MNTNELKSLAERAVNIEGRQAVRLAEVHYRIRAVRRRRTIGATATVLALIVGTIGGAALLTEADERPPEIVDTPSPTPTLKPEPTPVPAPEPQPGSVDRLSPREVVTADNAELMHAAVSAENPDVRISIWEAVCDLCEIPSWVDPPTAPSFKAMALTTDGYQTTTYTRSPFRQGPPYRIESLPRNRFLLVDDANGQEVLVSIDGTIRRVERVSTPIPWPNAHWFECLSIPFATSPLTWCALDPATATAYASPANGINTSVYPPGTSQPWGYESRWPGAAAIWWESNGSRQEAEVIVPRTSRAGVLRGADPALWTLAKRSKFLEFHVVDQKTGKVNVISRPAPDLQAAEVNFLEIIVTPEGGLLAAVTGAYSRSAPLIWRAPSLTADFEMVFDEALAKQPVDIDEGGLRLGEDRIYVGAIGVVESFDDGRTWSTISTWR